jgi:hypothetical protein
MEFSALFDVKRRDAEFLLRFPDRGFAGRLAGFETSARGIDFSGTKPALFSDEEDLPVADDKAERRTLGGQPAFPEFGHDATIPEIRNPDSSLSGRRKESLPTWFPENDLAGSPIRMADDKGWDRQMNDSSPVHSSIRFPLFFFISS